MAVKVTRDTDPERFHHEQKVDDEHASHAALADALTSVAFAAKEIAGFFHEMTDFVKEGRVAIAQYLEEEKAKVQPRR